MKPVEEQFKFADTLTGQWANENVFTDALQRLKDPAYECWLMLVGSRVGSEIWKQFEDTMRVHPVVTESVLDGRVGAGMTSGNDYIFVSVPVATGPGRSTTALNIFRFPGGVVTHTPGPCAPLDELFGEWSKRTHRDTGVKDGLMFEVMDTVLDQFGPELDRIQERVDGLEDALYRGVTIQPSQTVRLKRSLLNLRKRASQLREAINQINRRETPLVSIQARPYFFDLYDQTIHTIESIDVHRDILSSLGDAQLSMQSNRLNEVMRNMTSLATILMVMALVTGVYGMNFKHMPELESRYGYPLVIAFLLLVFVGGLAIASKIGWFVLALPKRKKHAQGPASKKIAGR